MSGIMKSNRNIAIKIIASALVVGSLLCACAQADTDKDTAENEHNKPESIASNEETTTTGYPHYIIVTDETTLTLDDNCQPITEEWITQIVYATNENGQIATDVNGEKITVRMTPPTYEHQTEHIIYSSAQQN